MYLPPEIESTIIQVAARFIPNSSLLSVTRALPGHVDEAELDRRLEYFKSAYLKIRAIVASSKSGDE